MCVLMMAGISAAHAKACIRGPLDFLDNLTLPDSSSASLLKREYTALRRCWPCLATP